MGNAEQIAAIKSGLAALDMAIVQAEGAIRLAATADDIRSLTSTLVGLRSERSRLQAQLDNLEAASVEVQLAMPATALTKVHASLDAALVDRSIVTATL